MKANSEYLLSATSNTWGKYEQKLLFIFFTTTGNCNSTLHSGTSGFFQTVLCSIMMCSAIKNLNRS